MIITVPCSKLEHVRNNPIEYARTIAEKGKYPSPIRKNGFFGVWREEIKSYLIGERTINDIINQFVSKCSIRFDNNPKNSRRIENLASKMLPFTKSFQKNRMELLFQKRDIREQFHTNVILTGHSPWITKDKSGYKVFFVSENERPEWINELRYPLIQNYLAKKVFNCDISDIEMGYYCATTSSFTFHSFTNKEIKEAEIEVKQAFTLLNNEYHKVKALM